MTEIRALMERWARWRCNRPGLGYGKTITAKLMEGMPGTNCPTCSGRGWTNVYPECPTCAGHGRVKLDPSATRKKINPALIKCTYIVPSDETSEKIDKLICKLRRYDKSQYFVIRQEYTRSGTQEIKAKRMHINFDYYRKLLQRAHMYVEVGLSERPPGSVSV